MMIEDHLAGSTGVVEVVRRTAAPSRPAPRNRTEWEGERAVVEIVAPDQFSARVLIELVGTLFPVELVGTGEGWVIRLRPPSGSAWEGEVLPLLQRWLETCPLPCATILCRGRRYVVRSSLTHTDIGGGAGKPPARERRRIRATTTPLLPLSEGQFAS
jgi:hypothetical protein